MCFTQFYTEEEPKMNEELMLMYREKLADNLPTLRAKLRMTQEDLAKILNISRHTIIGIENHSRTMTWTTYLAIIYILQRFEETKTLAVALGVTPVEFDAMLSGKTIA